MRLQPEKVFMLQHDETVVLCETVESTHAAVLALPEQIVKSKVFRFGAIKPKKISPFSVAVREYKFEDLTPLNQKFIIELAELRKTQGPNFVFGDNSQEDDVSVVKMQSKRRTRGDSDDEDDRPSKMAGSQKFRLVSVDLDKARAQPRGDKYNEGNRSFRVFESLRKLPGSTGTLDEIIVAVCTDGGKALTDPEKVVRRALQQMQTAAFGNIVQPVVS